MSYRPDARTVDRLIDDTRSLAATIAVPGLELRSDGTTATWQDVLDGDQLSFDLVRELLQAHHGLLDHLAELPERAQRYWLEQTCGIAALESLPAWTVVTAEVADDSGPVLIEAGTELKGPKDAGGSAVTFSTADNLVAGGATVQAIRSFGRRDAVGTVADEAIDGDALVPFGVEVARHELVLCSGLLTFSGGVLRVTVTFFGSTIDVAELVDLTWTYSTVDGEMPTTAVSNSADQVEFELVDGCAPLPTLTDSGEETHCFLRASVDQAALPGLVGYAFDDVKLSVVREGVVPDGAFYNDGTVDIEREFKPFGDVPRRGDSFYLQSEEALSKPLANLSVSLTPLDTGEYDALQLAILVPIVLTTEDGSFSFEPLPPKIEWQIRQNGSWKELKDANLLTSVSGMSPDRGTEPAADVATLAGVDGRAIRAFLKGGDFGWDAYEKSLVGFANTVAGVGGANTAMPTAPKPPTLRSVTLAYETVQLAPDRVIAVNGFSRRSVTAGAPFVHPVNAQTGDPATAVVHIGLTMPDAMLGQTLSLWFDVVSTAACTPSVGEESSRWEIWNGTGWDRLSTSDATDTLRTSGLLRFVAPLQWSPGCPEAGAIEGRWIRLVTDQPDRVGFLSNVLPDAVRAVAAPLQDGSVADLGAPEIGSVKGPNIRIDGVKKVSNPLLGRASRPAESDGDYVRRAPQITRTRNRLIQPVDYELDVRAGFPEIAFVSCLPHFDGSDTIAPGHVGLVIIPDSEDPAPLPSSDLVSRVERSTAERAPLHASVAVHCPSYRRLTVTASITLARGEAALTAGTVIAETIDRWLHPVGRPSASLGQPIYRSEVISLIEALAVVDRIETLDLAADDGSIEPGPNGIVERIDPPLPRRLGMVVSSGAHDLQLMEQLT